MGTRSVIVVLSALASAGFAKVIDAHSSVSAGAHIATVRTAAGEIQGFVHDGIFTFRGIPYASAGRFLPPQAFPAWSGVRYALSYGNICPQSAAPSLGEPQTFISDNRFWPDSEACQVLNVWTPGLESGKRRPVMVWLHGGGFTDGASNSLAVYDGTNLSRDGEVVVVSVNHRLGVLGFLNLSAYGDRYRESANVGMLDIVAALHWVQENIARFGGDPGNVTIFGQSGGGAKVATLMSAPAAKGLFHKAIIESGAPGSVPSAYSDQTVSRRVAAMTLQEAGLSEQQVDQLQSMPYEALLAAATRALKRASQEQAPRGAPLGFLSVNWAPVVDGTFLRESPFSATAPEISKGVPLMIGSTLSEFQRLPNPAMREHQKWSAEVIAAFQRAYPGLNPSEYSLIDTRFRAGVLRTAGLKAQQGDPVWCYLFAWKSPVLDYAWAAGHSSELAFVFDNVELGVQSTGGGPEVEALTKTMSRAWVSFARSGNPNYPGFANWPTFRDTRHATMMFDRTSHVLTGHDDDLVRLLAR